MTDIFQIFSSHIINKYLIWSSKVLAWYVLGQNTNTIYFSKLADKYLAENHLKYFWPKNTLPKKILAEIFFAEKTLAEKYFGRKKLRL